ncbi:cell adhesion molecule DSCAML1-like [Mytilus californianus]|uniref:cell adhesion molecule DSCAML1-like n=1 Tax=Mytilus californianus TaxID=6549 RepID=UPI00224604D7|nr:cell adhesion molecule DSCAML1-like [Mytilus californianus]
MPIRERTTPEPTVKNHICRKTPRTPVLTGPTEIISGTPTSWTCTSDGGYPVQKLSMRVGNSKFSTELDTKTAFDSNTQTYTVTGTLSWAPTTANDGQTLYCDVTHPETIGPNNPQTVSLPLTVKSPLDVDAPQTQFNPTTGETISLTCIITSGTATQVRWYKNNKLVIMAANLRFSGGNANTPSLTITQVQLTDAGSYICGATDGSATRNTTTITVSPKATPQPPTLTGPSTLTPGTLYTWTCVSLGGYPEQTMSIRVENSVFTNEATFKSEYDDSSKAFRVTGTLVWSPGTTTPQTPVLTGPASVLSGTSNTWTCVSTGGYPEQTMSIRVDNSVFRNDVTFNTVYDESSKTYRVTGTLVWSPTTTYNGETLYCDVLHPDTLGNSPQTPHHKHQY